MISDEMMNEYLDNGGVIFRVSNVDFLRDGGTTIIETTKGNFYIDKQKTGLFNMIEGANTPEFERVMITDLPLIAYLLHEINKYMIRLKGKFETSERISNFLLMSHPMPDNAFKLNETIGENSSDYLKNEDYENNN